MAARAAEPAAMVFPAFLTVIGVPGALEPEPGALGTPGAAGAVLLLNLGGAWSLIRTTSLLRGESTYRADWVNRWLGGVVADGSSGGAGHRDLGGLGNSVGVIAVGEDGGRWAVGNIPSHILSDQGSIGSSLLTVSNPRSWSPVECTEKHILTLEVMTREETGTAEVALGAAC
jgi:hypothetical protein